MVTEAAPTTEEWQALLDAAARFKEMAPWQWMEDSDLFGVEDPESGQIGYCCIMGALGEHLALGVYLGAEGLDCYHRVAERGVADYDLSIGAIPMLMASFEDREQLEAEDREMLRRIGRKFRGRQSWPLFRSYRPGYLPWHLNGAEARFLTTALEQALEVALQFRAHPDSLTTGSSATGHMVWSRGADGAWKSSYRRTPPIARKPLVIPALDDDLVQDLRALPLTASEIAVGGFVAPMPIQEEPGERPYLPQVTLAVESDSGYVLSQSLGEISTAGSLVMDALTKAIAVMKGRPARIWAQNDEVRAYADPLARSLSIPIGVRSSLPALEEALDSLKRYLRPQ